MAIRMTAKEPLAQPAKARPVAERTEPIMPTVEAPKVRGPRGRPSSGKVIVTIRLDPDVVAKFKATGEGWQARMNDALKSAKL